MDDAALIYLEADDEVTSLVRRVRAAAEPRVVVVAPGRSRATSSVVALRLLARSGAEEGREIAVVGDSLTRSLAAEAGLAAYPTVDDARRADPVDPTVSAPRRAGIHVVRGSDADEAALVPLGASSGSDAAWAETRPIAVARPTPGAAPRAARRPARRRVPVAVVGAILALLLVASVVAGAVLLPAASVTLTPRTVPLAPRTYTLEMEGERVTSAVDEVATVTATGTYPILVQATGVVTFRNFNVSQQEVPAETLVAVGEEDGAQAFATVTSVIVPAGLLAPNGTVQAGEADARVEAFAAGSAGNVPAKAIDTVLSEGPRNRLRGFSNNETRLVENPEPTSGGFESTGPEIIQADVDAAVATLRTLLAEGLAEAIERPDTIAVPVGALSEPVFTGLEDLVARRDQASIEIGASQAYDQWRLDRAEIEEAAAERLAADGAAVAPGQRLVEEDTSVEITGTVGTAEGVEVTVEVSGRTEALVDEAAVVQRIRGLGLEDAEAALEDLGAASIDLWPGWAMTVPDLEWRIRVAITGDVDDPAQLTPSGSP